MNIVNKLTLRHLKENKGRTIVTILGIIVSVAMITAVFVAGASFLDFMGNDWYLSDGHYHFKVTSDYKDLKKNPCMTFNNKIILFLIVHFPKVLINLIKIRNL